MKVRSLLPPLVLFAMLMFVIFVISMPSCKKDDDTSGSSGSNTTSGSGLYNANDYNQMRTFLTLPSVKQDLSNGDVCAKRNGDSSVFNPDDPNTWYGVTFEKAASGNRRLISFEQDLPNDVSSDLQLAGDLVLKNCNKLKLVAVNDNSLTSINLEGTSVTPEGLFYNYNYVKTLILPSSGGSWDTDQLLLDNVQGDKGEIITDITIR